MTTLANPKTRAFANTWDAMFPSAVFAGIVAGNAHVQNGYHVSIEDNPAGNYSITRVDDKAPPGNWSRNEASAVDMGMNTQDMTTCTRRLKAVWASQTDSRRKYFNAFNGWEGSGDAIRYDLVTRTTSVATPDHKQHVHLEVRRRYVNDDAAYAAALSILRGEPDPLNFGDGMPKLVVINDGPMKAGAIYKSDGLYRAYMGTMDQVNRFAAFWGINVAALPTISWQEADLLLGKEQIAAGPKGDPGPKGEPGINGKDGKDGTIRGTYVISPAA